MWNYTNLYCTVKKYEVGCTKIGYLNRFCKKEFCCIIFLTRLLEFEKSIDMVDFRCAVHDKCIMLDYERRNDQTIHEVKWTQKRDLFIQILEWSLKVWIKIYSSLNYNIFLLHVKHVKCHYFIVRYSYHSFCILDSK